MAAFKTNNGGGQCRTLPHFRCWARYLFISNMVALSLPNTLRSLSSARISRRFSGFCRLLALMYSHTLLTTSPRGRESAPTTSASSAEGFRGCCSAFGFDPAAFVVSAFLSVDFALAFFGLSACVFAMCPPEISHRSGCRQPSHRERNV